MHIKTSELIGPALDWSVENALLVDRGANPEQRAAIASRNRRTHTEAFSYHLNRAQGGPINEREKLELRPGLYSSELWACWGQTQYGHRRSQQGKTGPTPLVAAMRCYVASKLADEVDLPDEFVNR